jgi:GAF domain-containing protein
LNSNNGLTLYIPVVKNDKLVAVLEMNHDEKEGSFSLADQQTAQVMAEHIAIFMTRLAE